MRLCGVVSTVKNFFHRLLIAVTRSNKNCEVVQSEIFGMRMVKDAQCVLKEKRHSCNK